ncbi:MAG: hypothetical protein KAT17_09510 [Candidatus Aminicenantes bacterium]|nr:hypothetical protein [Candidatus Aminicenantes bacterium]
MFQDFKLIIHLIGCIISIVAGAPIVAAILKRFHFKDMPCGFKNAGKLIGQLERFLIYIALFVNSIAFVGIVLTLKAIYRFGDIQGNVSQKMKISEYFIIGTFSSLTFVFVVFGICTFIIKMLY